MTQNQIAFYKAKNEAQHYQVSDAETNRANLAREAETYRSNVAREAETNRSNIATEQERERANRASEANSRYATNVNRQHYERLDAETNRSNLANEKVKTDTLGETKRSNLEYESQGRANVESKKIEAEGRSNQGKAALKQADTSEQRRVDDWINNNRKLTQDYEIALKRYEMDKALTDERIKDLQSQQTARLFNNIRNAVDSADTAVAIVERLIKESNINEIYKEWQLNKTLQEIRR